MAIRLTKRRSAASSAVVDEPRTRVYYFLLLLTLFLEYVRPGTFVPIIGAIKLGTIVPGVLLLATLLAPGLRPWREIFSDRYAKWLVAFIALIALSLTYAPVTLYAYNILTTVVTQFTLFLMITRIATSVSRLRGIFVTLIVAHLALILLNPALILTPDIRSYIRGSPFLGDGNDFALSLCILLPMSIEIARQSRSKPASLLAWLATAAILLAVLGTQSRGASLAVAAVLIFLWRYSSKKMVAFAAITLTGLFVAFYASDAYLNRMRTISHYENDGSAQGRLRAWNASIQMALHRPLTGVGAGQFPTTYGRYYRGEAGGPWITAHSMYFLILGELGFPGIIVLLALVIGSPFALLALRRRVLAATHGPPTTEQSEAERFLCMLAAACVGFAVAGAFLSVAYYPHLFVLTAVTAATRLSIQSRLCGSSPPSAAVRERPLARRAPSGGARSRDSNAPGVRRGI